MKIMLEVPDHKAAFVMELLQSIPFIKSMAVRTEATQTAILEPSQSSGTTQVPQQAVPVTEAEQNILLHQLFGSWQSEESGDELVRQIYEARQDRPRDVEL